MRKVFLRFKTEMDIFSIPLFILKGNKAVSKKKEEKRAKVINLKNTVSSKFQHVVREYNSVQKNKGYEHIAFMNYLSSDNEFV